MTFLPLISWQMLDNPAYSSLCDCCESTCRSRKTRSIATGMGSMCPKLTTVLNLHFYCCRESQDGTEGSCGTPDDHRCDFLKCSNFQQECNHNGFYFFFQLLKVSVQLEFIRLLKVSKPNASVLLMSNLSCHFENWLSECDHLRILEMTSNWSPGGG